MANRMTPKRAAQLIVYHWITCGGTSPWYMDAEEMTLVTEDSGYKVTEKRRDEIIRHVDKIMDPVKDRCAAALEKAGFSI